MRSAPLVRMLAILPLTTVLLAASALVAGAQPAKKKIVFLTGLPTLNINDAYSSILPKFLGYFAEEGLDVDIRTTQGAGQALQLVAGGQGEIGVTVTPSVLSARQDGVSVRAFYNYLRRHATSIAIPADSPVKSVKDLKGKRIGMFGAGSVRTLDGKAMVKAGGLDPEKDVSWVAVGFGPQAAQAITSKQIDALVLWDAAYAELENLGLKFRYLTFPFQEDLPSLIYIARDDYIAQNPDVIVAFGRAVAKANLFAETNPEAAVRATFRAQSGSIAPGISREKAFTDALVVLKSNLKNSTIRDAEVKLWGSFTKETWARAEKYYLDLGIITRRLPDVGVYYVDQSLVTKMNAFDAKKVIEQAKNYRD